jgi:hypothetical protein
MLLISLDSWVISPPWSFAAFFALVSVSSSGVRRGVALVALLLELGSISTRLKGDLDKMLILFPEYLGDNFTP